MQLQTVFNSLCAPAKIYLVLSTVAIVVGIFNKFSFMAIMGKILFMLFWVFILNYLCMHGLKTLSWLLVLLPYIIMLFVFMGMMKM